MTYAITQACIDTEDKSCVDVCPVTAIVPDTDVPANQTQYLKINADAFKSATPPQRPTG